MFSGRWLHSGLGGGVFGLIDCPLVSRVGSLICGDHSMYLLAARQFRLQSSCS